MAVNTVGTLCLTEVSDVDVGVLNTNVNVLHTFAAVHCLDRQADHRFLCKTTDLSEGWENLSARSLDILLRTSCSTTNASYHSVARDRLWYFFSPKSVIAVYRFCVRAPTIGQILGGPRLCQVQYS